MSKNNKKCPICDSEDTKESIYPGYSYKGRKYKNHQCEKCSFIFVNPVPDKEIIEEIYNDPDYFDSYFVLNSNACGYLNSREAGINNAKKILQKIKSYANGFKLLEVGCAGGFFLSAAKEEGFDITGIELNEEMVKIANKEFGNRVIHGDIADIKIKGLLFDVVYMGDVLEHIAHFSETVNYIKDILTENGILVIEGPITYNRTVFNLFLKLNFFLRKNNCSGNPPTHLQEFMPGNLSVFLEKHSFRILYTELSERQPLYKKLYFQNIRSDFSGAPRPKDQGSLPSRKQCAFILWAKALGFLRGIKSASWYLKIVSAAISNSWVGRRFGLGDRIVMIAAKKN